VEKFSYLSVQNVGYIEEQFHQFLKSPGSIDPEWRLFFEGLEFARKLGGGGASASPGAAAKELKAYDLIRAYRQFGARKAQLDPLGLTNKEFEGLHFSRFGLTEGDLDQPFAVGETIGLSGATLRKIIERLEQLYCGTLTAEWADCDPAVQHWFQQEFEKSTTALLAESRQRAHEALVKAEGLEKFIHIRFVGAKRFSVEGGESLMPMMEHLLELGSQDGMEELVVGMAHRGRVNMLANFCGKPVELLFAEFLGHGSQSQGFSADGDVKYHMGFSQDRQVNGANIHISLAFNPSHLEAVDPVVIGMTRAKQRLRQDNKERKRVLPVLIHGDAAFIGQGVVAETLQLSQLEGYTVGGTLHIVVNNQVGFTTSPQFARSVPFCTDIARSLRVPVLHVNGDDVDSCLRALALAYRFRQAFRQDVVIDLVCFRRFGHNEADEPAFTQPVMYDSVKNHPTVREIYSRKLVSEAVMEEGKSKAALDAEMDRLGAILDKTKSEQTAPRFFALEGVWKGLRRPNAQDIWTPVSTQAEEAILRKVAQTITQWPEGFQPHPKLQKLLEGRKKMMETGEFDWGMAELLAYGALVLEGIPVRISGQDAGRGTFTHRHALFHDSKTGARYSPLNTLNPDRADFAVHDSSLSEYGVLGFEYGNSSTDPRSLVIWEAQFGDFANGAQIIIDQFMASAESKWQRMTGLTLLLPHGYEGQGPEHSSARMERFLQLCAQDNLQVAYPTTPGQIFHILRRQVKRDFRKPLVIMSPKSLLRHPKVISTLSDLTKGGFREVLGDSAAAREPSNIKKVILCSGKLYYELVDERSKSGQEGSVAIVRVEQIYPFPAEQIAQQVRLFPNLKQIIWAQEEPKNMGAYSFVAPRLQELFVDLAGKGVAFRYLGRTERASPAIGSAKGHEVEQQEIIKGCFR
jgi:2-oxoglutarate dehydrogenase E1 component